VAVAPARIDNFRGRHLFLSNFWEEDLWYRGRLYRTAEHAFQAAKAADQDEYEHVVSAPTPAEAKKRGRRVQKRPDWDVMRVPIMLEILCAKFAPGSRLAGALENTGDLELVEGNTWGDVDWGVCRGDGLNLLGRLLMIVRDNNRKIASRS
jgi:ribA/ribD-fused uncharacterized protein